MQSKIVIHNLSKASDTVLLQGLLSTVSQSVLSSVPTTIDCKNAGTVLRFLTAFLSGTPGVWRVIGDDRLSERPITDLICALKQLGANISGEKLPLLITGIPEIEASSVTLNTQKSSQFASALMLMIAKFPNGLQINFEGEMISKPYFDMTAQLLQQCGVEISFSENSIKMKGIPEYGSSVFIESDWSSASYFYALAALSEKGTVYIENLHLKSLQGDAILAKWFEKFGVQTTFGANAITIRKEEEPLVSEIEMDFKNHPDLAQTLAVVCAAKNIPARLTGLSSLRDKETDRLQALSAELNRIGATNRIEQTSLILNKHEELNFRKSIQTYEDHRMAMAFSIFSGMYEDVMIENHEIVKKSFPDYWEQINLLYNSN